MALTPAVPYVMAEYLEGSRYLITVRNASDATCVQIPAWSEENGQDDIVWYAAEKQENCAWTVQINTARHGCGLVIAHAYVDGEMIGAVLGDTRL